MLWHVQPIMIVKNIYFEDFTTFIFLVYNNSKLVNKTKCIIKLIQVQFNSILKPNQSHFLKLY